MTVGSECSAQDVVRLTVVPKKQPKLPLQLKTCSTSLTIFSASRTSLMAPTMPPTCTMGLRVKSTFHVNSAVFDATVFSTGCTLLQSA